MAELINGFTVNPKPKTKTEKVIKFIAESGETVENRGHLSIMIRHSGIEITGAIFNSVAKIVNEVQGGELGNSAFMDKKLEKKNARARAYQMSVADVRAEIDKGATELFWACWDLYKNEGQWSKTLTAADFAVNFRKG